MKRVLMLGGSIYQTYAIKEAVRQGHYVITCDYLPDNPGHKFAHEYHNVSTTDKEAVLELARKLKVDGVVAYASDPAAPTAAYVCEKLGLPTSPYKSVEILSKKHLFRKYLAEHGFNVPKAKGYNRAEDAMTDAAIWDYPIIVKPTDAAGSKGVTRVDEPSQLKAAVEYAFDKSLSGHIIIEDFIEKQGCSSDTDSFSVDGKLKFVSFCAQRFDLNASNPYTPAAYSWPSTFTKEQEAYLTSEIQRLINLLGMKTNVYNIETRVGTNGKPYIMELTPRGGGNRLCEMLRYATGVDMITAMTRYIVGDSVPAIEQKPYNGHWAEIILHADENGTFDHLEISKDLPAEVVEEDLWVKKGDTVKSFEGANDAIGTLVLKFQSAEELEKAITNQREWLKVVVE